MNKKPFLFIFAGVVAAGLLCLIVGLIVFYAVTGNAVATIVSLFAIIAGSIMGGIGLISLLIVILLTVIGRKKARDNEDDGENGEPQPEE